MGQKKKVSTTLICCHATGIYSTYEAIKNWLYNHSRARARKALVKYGRKWNARSVIMKSRTKDIAAEFEKAGIPQGSSNMIKGYQKVVGSVMGNLTQEERDAAAEEAIVWNEEQPPAEVQAE